MNKIISTLIFSLSISLFSFSQQSFTRLDTIPVRLSSSSSNLLNAWAGGLNACQFSAIDLNFDGIKDLVVFDRSGNRLKTFINAGISDSVRYIHAPQFESKFPIVHDWIKLIDYNCDGKEDIFTYGLGAMVVYKNTSSIATGIQFEMVTNYLTSLYPNNPPVYINIYSSAVDFPAIIDLDGDGDLDILTFTNLGTFVEYHKNMSIELFGHCDSLKFQLEDDCWGKFSENFANNSVQLNISCKGSMAPSVPNASNNPLHAGSTMLAFDPNKDGLIDLMLGDISFTNLNLLFNGGSTSNAHITSQDSTFPTYNLPVNMNIFPVASYLDLNNDSKKDLLVSPFAPNVSENFNSVWYYKNTAIGIQDSFTFQKNNFLQDQMIEVGEGAYPTLFDYDGDGDDDLIVANYGYYSTGGNFNSRLALFRNYGTNVFPRYELITRDYANLSFHNLRAMYPTFGDLDGDGDKDMIIGDIDGRLHYFENLGGAGNMANFVLAQPNYFGIDVGQFATPQLFDVNSDGKLDLIIGERNGTFNYAPNLGTISNPQFSTLVEFFGNVSVTAPNFTVGYSTPFMYRKNNITYMLSGSESGRLFLFSNIDNNLNGTFTILSSDYNFIREGIRTAVFCKDINNDGYDEMWIGNYAGGLSFYKGIAYTGIEASTTNTSKLKIYPNPAYEYVNIQIPALYENAIFQVFDLSGRKILEENLPEQKLTHIFSINNLQKGVYFIVVSKEGLNSISEKLMVQ
ncbi:MAG: FG-GAP-like repeat-containing protein [Bacteroidia bacterium]